MQAQMIYKGHTDATEGVAKSTGNPWRKVVGIFETVEHFPKTIAVTGMNSVCEDILNCQQGKLYIVDFDIESRSWTDPKTNVEKWFTDAKAWRIQPAVQASAPGVQAQPQAVPSFDTPIPPIGKATQTRIDMVPPTEDNPKDDLPF